MTVARGISLRACYLMCGMGIAYGAIGVHTMLLCGTKIHPEIQHKKPQLQYNLYQECGFLRLISGCSVSLYAPAMRCALEPPLSSSSELRVKTRQDGGRRAVRGGGARNAGGAERGVEGRDCSGEIKCQSARALYSLYRKGLYLPLIRLLMWCAVGQAEASLEGGLKSLDQLQEKFGGVEKRMKKAEEKGEKGEKDLREVKAEVEGLKKLGGGVQNGGPVVVANVDSEGGGRREEER
eukprot:944451-Rhodomonas_salina.1